MSNFLRGVSRSCRLRWPRPVRACPLLVGSLVEDLWWVVQLIIFMTAGMVLLMTYMVVWCNVFFAVEAISNRKRWLYPGPYSEAFLFQLSWCGVSPRFIESPHFYLLYHWCLIPYRMMLFSPGMFCYGRFSVSPLLVLTGPPWYGFPRLSWFHQCTPLHSCKEPCVPH